MIRHLIGRGDVLTECGLTAAVPGSLMTNLDDVNCRDCRRALIARGVCPECGEKKLTWATAPRKKSPVADGRLTMNDVETIFYLGCDECSETLITDVDPETIAAALTRAAWRP